MPAKYIWTPLKIETGLVMWWVGAIRIFRVCFHDLPDSTLLYFFIFSLLLLLSLTIDGLSLSHFVKPSFCSLFPLKARVCGAWSILAYDHMHFCISEPFRSCCLSLSLWNLRRTDFLRGMALSVHLSSSLLFSSLHQSAYLWTFRLVLLGHDLLFSWSLLIGFMEAFCALDCFSDWVACKP